MRGRQAGGQAAWSRGIWSEEHGQTKPTANRQRAQPEPSCTDHPETDVQLIRVGQVRVRRVLAYGRSSVIFPSGHLTGVLPRDTKLGRGVLASERIVQLLERIAK